MTLRDQLLHIWGDITDPGIFSLSISVDVIGFNTEAHKNAVKLDRNKIAFQ